MKISYQDLVRILVAGLMISVLAACGGDSNDEEHNDDDHEHEHDHGAVVVSQSGSNSLSLVDEGSLEAFEDSLSFTSATFVRSDNGEFAAIKGGSEIQFIGEDGISEFTVMGSEVIATNGHFSILDAGSSTLVAVESLESTALESESTMSLSLSEVYPAVVLDEVEEVLLVFVAGEAQIYEGGEDTTESFDCTNPSSTAQAHHAAIVTCDEGVNLVVFEEDSVGITYEITSITVDGTAGDYVWQSIERVFAGYAPGTTNYAIIHLEEDHSTEVILGSSAEAETLTENICAAGLETEDEDFLFWLAGGSFIALTNEGVLINPYAVDTSNSTSCSDYSVTVTAKTMFVVDNDAMMFYELDMEEGASSYHVHESHETVVSDIAASVALYHNEEGSDGHDHEHVHE